MGYRSALEWLAGSSKNIYIGRESRRHGLRCSMWHNQYTIRKYIRKYGLSECLKLYRKMITGGVDEYGITNNLFDDLHEQRANRLDAGGVPTSAMDTY